MSADWWFISSWGGESGLDLRRWVISAAATPYSVIALGEYRNAQISKLPNCRTRVGGDGYALTASIHGIGYSAFGR